MRVIKLGFSKQLKKLNITFVTMDLNYSHNTSFRVRYSETDQMGFCYYGNYPTFLEVGRVEALRNLEIVYSELEKQGILLPVATLNIKYLSPAKYDQQLFLKSILKKVGACSLFFEYVIVDEKNKRIIEAETTLVFVSVANMKPMRIPDWINQILSKYELQK